jgi:CRP-like cAMP-binding protein
MALGVSKDVIKSCLKSVPLFADLADVDIERLAAVARPVAFKKGARIFEEGTPADCCFVLTSGRARVVLSGGNGTEILLHILTPPSIVGEIALLDRSTRSASLVALDACHLLRIPGAALEALRQNMAFEQRLIAGLVATLRESDDRVRAITTFPAINRVAWCLGRLARHSGRRDGASMVITKPAHGELAEMAGCTRETVSRALAVLRRRALVSWDANSMRIDIAGLRRYLATESTGADDAAM